MKFLGSVDALAYRLTRWAGILILVYGTLGLSGSAGLSAQQSHVIRIATLAPRGTPLVSTLQRWNRALQQETGGQVSLQIFPGGISGDEGVVVQKMRARQLDAAALTTTGLGAIARPTLILGAPGLITTYGELDAVRREMAGQFNAMFDQAGYRLLAWGDAGRIRLFSNRRIQSPSDLASARPWVWRDNPIMVEFVRQAGANGVPLCLPEVYPGLQTNRIDTVFSSAVAAVGFQWFSRLRYVGGQSSGVVIGALVIKQDCLDSLPPAARDFMIRTATETASNRSLQRAGRGLDDRAFTALQSRGLEVLDFQESRREWETLGERVTDSLVGRLYSRELLDQVRAVVARER